MISDFIYIKENEISKNICEDIIYFFETNELIQKEGLAGDRYNPSVKKTMDIGIEVERIPCNLTYPLSIVLQNIKKNLVEYNALHSLNLKYNDLIIRDMNIQKYIKDSDYYKSHNDFSIDEGVYRVYTFIYYLNDVECGGETDFYFMNIKPESGKLLIFPADSIFQHEGKTPFSNDKYILTGWLYLAIP